MNNAYDSGGIYGAYLHYGLTVLMVGGALIIFVYLWHKGRLNMDEEPKMRMMDDQEEYDRK